MLVELIDVEVADFRHARYEHASRKTGREHPQASSWRGAGERLEKLESREEGWSEAGGKLEGGWKEAGGRLGRGCFPSLLSRPAAAASPLWPCSHIMLLLLLLSLYAPPPGIGSKLLPTCM